MRKLRENNTPKRVYSQDSKMAGKACCCHIDHSRPEQIDHH